MNDKSSGKVVGKAAEEKKNFNKIKKKRRPKRKENFFISVYRILKMVHPDLEITQNAMEIMNCLLYDILDKISNDASKLVSYNKKSTTTSREIQTAVRLLLSGELSKLGQGSHQSCFKVSQRKKIKTFILPLHQSALFRATNFFENV